jgi:hypothetical protein
MAGSLEDYCNTDRQLKIVRMRQEGASWPAIAKAINVSDDRNLRRMLKSIEAKAAAAGFAPDHDMTHSVPEGFTVKGVSTYYNEDGIPTGQWVKSQSDRERQAKLLLDAVEESATLLKRFKPVAKPKQVDEDLCSLLTITDFHLGMKAWKESDGEDWDVTIARDVFLQSIHDMVSAAPKSGTSILNQLGDFFHWDGLIPMTPTSKHILTGDDRYSKLVELTINIMTEAVHIMLKKFGRVVIVQAEGNHDLASSVWIRKYMKHRFQDDPRVSVIDNEFPYYAYLHGKTMLGFHHGHRLKMAQLQKLFASEPRFREMWGQANHCYIHCGHLHHERVLEDAGATVEQHPTLATRDNYSSSHGYVSQRGAKVITYDKSDGEIHRVTVRPEK